MTHQQGKDTGYYLKGNKVYIKRKQEDWKNWNKNKVKSELQVKGFESAEKEMQERRGGKKKAPKWWKPQKGKKNSSDSEPELKRSIPEDKKKPSRTQEASKEKIEQKEVTTEEDTD